MMASENSAPTWRFLFAHPAHLVACGFGSGLSPVAPGTAGTLFAWLSYAWLRPGFDVPGFAEFLLVTFLLGIYCCDKTGRDLGVADHGAMVWDEIVPFWAVLFLCPEGGWWALSAFLLFRFFDIVKPPPARDIDRRMKNGLGVMADDLVAAGYTLLVLALVKTLFL